MSAGRAFYLIRGKTFSNLLVKHRTVQRFRWNPGFFRNFSHLENTRQFPVILQKNHAFSTPHTITRNKTQKKKGREVEEDSDDDEDEPLTDDPHAKISTTQTVSMRADLIIKATMGMARNKVEVALYESKIRLNGQKILKKSVQIQVGDVLDFIKGPSPKNPDFLVVTRVSILAADPTNDAIRIKYSKDKSLVIDNYEDEWTPLNAQ